MAFLLIKKYPFLADSIGTGIVSDSEMFIFSTCRLS